MHPFLLPLADATLLARDARRLSALKIHEGVSELDQWVLQELKTIGYDVADLDGDFKSEKVSKRAAAYKMLKRKLSVAEIQMWQHFRLTTSENEQVVRLGVGCGEGIPLKEGSAIQRRTVHVLGGKPFLVVPKLLHRRNCMRPALGKTPPLVPASLA
jgi:hypothetical protein